MKERETVVTIEGMQFVRKAPYEGGNIFKSDPYNMGIALGKSPNGEGNIMIMLPNHTSEECQYMTIVDEATGRKVQVIFKEV